MWLSRKWPRIDLYQKGGRSDLKILSGADLDRLMRKASEMKWSADGRPQWWAEHCDQFRSATLVVFGTEGSEVYRCIATIALADRSGGRFTLDVSKADFDALEELDRQGVVELAHRYLATFPAVDLDQHQAATWDESIWKRWGES